MKKFISLITLCTFFLLMSGTTVKAQKEQGQISIGAGAGWSLIGGLFSAISGGTNTTFASPVWNATFDYGLSDNFSLGIAFGYQTMGINYVDYWYTNSQGTTVTEDFKWTLSRMNIAARPLIHFGHSEDLDLYAGIRAGITNWGSKTESSDPNFDEGQIKMGNFGFQALFGTRYYFSEMIGMHFEVGLGAPYLVEGGISVRL